MPSLSSEEDYLEVMGVRDRQEYLSSAGPGGGLLEFLSHGDGSAS